LSWTKSLRRTVKKRGYIYVLGEHRVMCGGTTNSEDFERLIEEKAIGIY
jgi:hypothetical protein